MKINEIIDEGKAGLVGKGLSWLGSKLTGAPAAPTAVQQAAPAVVRPSNIPRQQWKKMTQQQRQAVTGQPAPAAPSAAPAVSPQANKIQATKDKLELARLQAELDAAKGTGIITKGATLAAKNPIKTAVGATMAAHLAGEKDPLSAQAVGSAARKTVGTIANVVKGFVGTGDQNQVDTADSGTSEPATATTDTTTGGRTSQAGKPSTDSPTSSPTQSAPAADDSVDAAPVDGNYVDKVRQNQDERFGQWGKEANESVKKKIKLDEVDTTQQAFMDAIRGAESGGRNIGNLSGSSAYGHYQFLKSTAERMARDQKNRNTPIYGKSWEEYKRDPDLQREFMKVATQNYTNIYTKNKIPVTGGTLYMAHHFGPEMAVRMYNAGPKATIGDFYPEYVTRKNSKTGQVEQVRNPVYTQNPALRPNQSVQYTHDRLDSVLAKKDKTNTLAALDKKNLWTGAGTATVASVGTTTPQAAKPAATDSSAEKTQTLAQKLDKIVQPEPRFYKRGELSIDQYMKKSQADLDRLRASAQRLPGSTVVAANTVAPDNTTKTATAASQPASAGTVVDEPNTDSDDKNKLNNTVAVKEHKLDTATKTVNKEIKDIIRLAGFTK